MDVVRILHASKLIPTNIAFYIHQFPVVQKLDSAIHRINHYPADKTNRVIHEIEIFPSASAFRLLNNRDQSVFFGFLKYPL